jgi:hypothetical protein
MANGISKAFYLGVLTFFLAACGGGGDDYDGGFTTKGTINVTITADKTTLAANVNNLPPDPSLPYTNTFTVQIERPNGQLYPAPSVTVDLVPTTANGALFYLDGDPEHEDKDTKAPLAYRRLAFEDTSGIVTGHFVASATPGTVQLVASAINPDTNEEITGTVAITINGPSRTVSSLTFTGPFVNAVFARSVNFGTAQGTILQDGTYSRLISVIANDASGNPVSQNTPIKFYAVDAPLTGFPNEGAGSFLIAGGNGNPVEGGFLFTADGGNFISKGVSGGYRLVLDGSKTVRPDNRFLTGIRVIENILSQTQLSIQQGGPPFNGNGADNGPTVPYIIGQPQHATILSPAFTDVTGTATTLLNYPAARLGQTAVLVACNEDDTVCTTLNTCDAAGSNCGPVYLGVSDPTTDKVNLTASLTTLPPNTSSSVELCLKDVNFAPLQASTINYDIGATGSGTVEINGNSARSGTLVTGSNGCVTAAITSSGQIPGSAAIDINFSAPNAQPVTVQVTSPGAGKLEVGALCDIEAYLQYQQDVAEYQQCLATAAAPEDCGTAPALPQTVSCSFDMRLVDDRGAPIPDIVVTYSTEGTVIRNITFDPAFGQFGITDANGLVTAEVEFVTGGETTITFSAGTAEYKYTLNTKQN